MVIVYIVYLVSVGISSAGITLWIILAILGRFHNVGDKVGSFKDYSDAIIPEALRNEMSRFGMQGNDFLRDFGDSPFENDNEKAPHMLKKNEDDIYGDLEDVDIPLFKSNN